MKQITIITEDRTGLLADVAAKMAEAKVNIETIDSEKIGESAVITMTVDQPDAALKALANTGLHAITEETVLVKIEDSPGALARIACRFKEANLNLRSVRLLRRQDKVAIVAISCPDLERARKLVEDIAIRQGGA